MTAPEPNKASTSEPQANGPEDTKRGTFFGRKLPRPMRTAGKGLLLIVLGLLACAALLRTLVALLEAAALLALALGAASLALPHGLGWYWREAQRQIPRWLQQLADSFVQASPEPRKMP